MRGDGTRGSLWRSLCVGLGSLAVSLGLFTALLSSGCEGGMARLRGATYPPGFSYLTRQEIQTTMGRLALQVDALDEAMRQPGGAQPQDRERIVEILEQMQSLADDLSLGTRSNHPMIDRMAPQLQHDIARALVGARQRTPDYYFAGLVSGACTYCHEPRHFQRTTLVQPDPRG